MLAKPSTCMGCELYGNGVGFSALEGTGESGLMVIAEALGAKEERKGLPLRPDAPAGGVFQQALDVGKLLREQMTLTNIVRCRPPGNELKGMYWERPAIDHCRQYLDAAVAERRPRLLLALGDVPLRELSLIPGGISELRGYVLPSRYNIPLIATYHPSHLARGAFGQLFGAFLHDVRQAQRFALRGVPEKLETNYVTSPNDTDFRNYLELLRSDVNLAAAHDIETPGILGEPEPKEWREKRILQVQFSSAVGSAIVCDWNNPTQRKFACEVYALPNPKWGWNDRLSDRPCLKANGVMLNGECHDLMNAWAHLQPNFTSGKDAHDEDKAVPAKLMSLQSCVSFYYPQEGPWKGMVQGVVKEAATQCAWLCAQQDRKPTAEELLAYISGSTSVVDTLRWYGARDSDMTFRVGCKIFASLKKLGLW